MSRKGHGSPDELTSAGVAFSLIRELNAQHFQQNRKRWKRKNGEGGVRNHCYRNSAFLSSPSLIFFIHFYPFVQDVRILKIDGRIKRHQLLHNKDTSKVLIYVISFKNPGTPFYKPGTDPLPGKPGSMSCSREWKWYILKFFVFVF